MVLGSIEIKLTSWEVRIGFQVGWSLQAGGSYGIVFFSYALSVGGRDSSILMVDDDWGSLDLLP